MIKTSELGSNSVEDEEANHVPKMWEVNKDRLSLMRQKISDPPQLLTKAAANSSCCIFKVPRRFIDINGSMLSRTRSIGLDLEVLLRAIQPLEMEARECYSQIIHLDTCEFVEMMVLDGVFIIELFRKVGDVVRFEADDPIVTMAWIIPFFYRDLLRLENQIPFFVLERLFEITRTPGEESGPSLSKLALDFFNDALQRPDYIIARHNSRKAKHLLDLVRSSFIDSEQAQPRCVDTSTPIIQSCHSGSSKHFTTYATLLDCLVNTFKDVEYLCDCNIIENYFGTDSEVARFINDLGKEVAFDIEMCYLSGLFSDVHQYYKNSRHLQWASFKFTYFSTPWSFISAMAALIILLLTVAQTLYTIYGTYKT
ncbi:hypothetical protein D5086_014529 [Populus alba]|uniref:Uncharacterized protein n=1 Tax=Populus alba TaxID=43335 RepID=A0ACC4BXR7_POPAL